MEVVISAAVLLLVVLGVMAGLDAVAGTAGANKARTVAAALAEKDQEELRSLKTADLNRIRELIPGPRTVNVDGVPYEITSDAVLVTDSKGEDISCTLESGEGSFLRITSTVRSPMTGAKVKPVVLSSIVAPEPGSGTLVAMVTNAEGKAVKNMPVQAVGPETKTKVTNESGCAVFGTMTAGSYEVKLNQLNWVNPEGDQEVIKTATVSAGQLTTVDFIYDVGASVTIQTIRSIYGGATVDDDSYGVIAAHTGILTGFRQFPVAATLAPSHTLTQLFPFEDPYAIYSGRCTGADPTGFDENYFTNVNPAAAPELDPGTSTIITLYEPAVNISVTFAGTPVNSSSARVYAYPRTAGCTDPARFDMGRTRTGGRADKPGLPFGTYDLCAQYTTGGVTYKASRLNVQNNAHEGTPVTPTVPTIAMTTSSTRNTCGTTAP